MSFPCELVESSYHPQFEVSLDVVSALTQHSAIVLLLTMTVYWRHIVDGINPVTIPLFFGNLQKLAHTVFGNVKLSQMCRVIHLK